MATYSSRPGNGLRSRVAVALLALVVVSTANSEGTADSTPTAQGVGTRTAPRNAGADSSQSAAWAPTGAQLKRLEGGAIVAEGDVSPERTAADIRAAVIINASPEQVFQTLTDCAQAVRFVPHLERCSVLDTAPDGTWQEVDHTVDYGWLAPRARYVFRADYQRFERIRFRHLRGDFHQNEGVWDFRPLKGGRQTLVIYRARMEPAFFVPRWMMRSMLKRDLPELMRGLRARSEAARPAVAPGTSRPP